MKTFYTIVYSPLSLVSQERLNLGMIMLNDQGMVFYQYSKEKLKHAKKVFSDEGFKLIKSYLSSIEQKISGKEKGSLINSLGDFRSDYLDYLSRYCNNLIGFAKPKLIDIELNKANFNKLFEKYVYKLPEEYLIFSEKTIPSIYSVKESIRPKVRGRVNFDINLKANAFDFVMFDLHIDMMGKNDRPFLNQFIDFNLTPGNLRKEITNYLSIVKPLEIQDGKSGKFFLVGDEPSKQSEKQQHVIWKHLNDSPLIRENILEVVPSGEISRVEEYLVDHDVKPYFPE